MKGMKMKTETKNETTPEATADFQNAVQLLALLTDVSNRLGALENEANDELLEILDQKRPDYAELQAKLNDIERGLELLALKHQEWFAVKKTIKTPYGVMRFRSSTKLEVPNEEATLAKLELMEAKDQEGSFRASLYTREEKTLNLEALEKLDDATLLRLGVKRVKEEKFSATPAKLEMGKAIEAAAAENETQEMAA
jgi:hypothetical protein